MRILYPLGFVYLFLCFFAVDVVAGGAVGVLIPPEHRRLAAIALISVIGVLGLLFAWLAQSSQVGAQPTQEAAVSGDGGSPEPAATTRESQSIDSSGRDAVLSFVAVLQREGRFLDFFMQKVDEIPDHQLAAAGRLVHRGVSGYLSQVLKVTPATTAPEGQVFDRAEHLPEADEDVVKMVGDTSVEGGQPHLLHKGWTVGSMSLPKAVSFPKVGDRVVVAPIQVEVRRG